MDYIGNIAVPDIPVCSVFSIKPDAGWSEAWGPENAIRQFGPGDARTEPAAAEGMAIGRSRHLAGWPCT
jgi:hypothetical protein